MSDIDNDGKESSMHPIEIPESVRNRILRMRGRLHPFDTIDLQRAALIVIDMQRFFLDVERGNIACAREIVPNVNRLAEAMRANGRPVIYTLHRVDADAVAQMPAYYAHFFSDERLRMVIDQLDAHSPHHALWPALDVADTDIQVVKTRFSAMIPGASELPAILKARAIDTLVIAGTATNVCCESTARDAMMLGYKIFFVSDATAAPSDEEHIGTLTNLSNVFADIRTTGEMLSLIEGARAP